MAFSTLNIALIETEIIDFDVDSNLQSIANRIAQLPEMCDVAILPELVTTGFVSDAERALSLAERNTGDSMHRIADMAHNKNCAVCGSFLARTAGRVFNRAFFIETNGDGTFYDKKHLFTMGGEREIFASSSKSSPIIRFRGWNIKPIICYDLRFPVFSRNRCDYDAIVYVANWPTSRLEVWRTLLKARAIENQCYVVGVNRCGHDPLCEYAGSSAVVDAYGRVMAEAGTDSQEVITVDLPLEPLQAFRRKFPVLADADSFSLLFSTTNDKKQEPIYE